MSDPVPTLGAPKDITNPEVLLERRMKGEGRGSLLTLLARRLLHRPDLDHWYRIEKTPQVTQVYCFVCCTHFDAGQKTFGTNTKVAIRDHGLAHFNDALQGKFQEKT